MNELEPGLEDTLVRDNPIALTSGLYRDRDAGTTTFFSDLERPAVESTDDGFRITYVVDGQRRSVGLSGADFGSDPRRPQSYIKQTADVRFRVGNSGVSGSITALESRPGDTGESSFTTASGGLSFNGTIDGDGISAADLAGSGVLAHYSNGTVDGAFYGPGAAEVAGVFEAAGTAGRRLLTGSFAGEKE